MFSSTWSHIGQVRLISRLYSCKTSVQVRQWKWWHALLYSHWPKHDFSDSYYKFTTDSAMETLPRDLLWFHSSIQLPVFHGYTKFAIWPASNLVWTSNSSNIVLSLFLLDFKPLLSSLQIFNFWPSFLQQMDHSALQPWIHVCCIQIFGWLSECIIHSVLLKTKHFERAYQCSGGFL